MGAGGPPRHGRAPRCHPATALLGVPGGDAASAFLDGCIGAKGHTTKLRAGTYKE